MFVVAPFAFTVGSASAGSQTTTNACQNSATGTFTDIDLTMSGTGSPNPVSSGGTVTVSGTVLDAFFPADVLVAGYNLGLLTLGLNNIPGTLDATIIGSNTAEGTQTLADLPLSGQTTITDPDGSPGTGDETATDLSVSVPIPDTVWTSTGGDIAFSAGDSVILASVFNGLIKVKFTCNVGSSTPAGCVGNAAVDCTGFVGATSAPFDTVVLGGATTTTVPASSTTVPASTTTVPASTTTVPASTTTVPASTTTVPASTTTVPASTTTVPASTTTVPASTTTVPAATTTVPVGASTGTYTTVCSNTVTPDSSTLSWSVSAIAPASAVVGETITVSDQVWSITIPGTVFDTGVNLNLIVDGQVINAELTAALVASNTAESSASEANIAVSVTVILDGTGAANDATVSFPVSDMTFQASGGDIDLSIGDVVMAVTIPPLPVPIAFSCSPESGQSPFHTVAVSGATVTTTAAPTTTTTVATQVAGVQELAFTGPGEVLVIVLIGFILLDLGYMAFTAARPRRRNESA